MKIGIAGMGLIGGSLCRALKAYTDHTVLGTTRNPASCGIRLQRPAPSTGR